MTVLDDGHYIGDSVGGQFELAGGGLHVYLTGDLLHPPMVDEEEIWANGQLWSEGAARHTIEVGQLAGLRPGESVLDIGCGVGGPARLLARRFGVSVTSIGNSTAHTETCRRLNARAPDIKDRLRVVDGDAQLAVPPGRFDAAVSINMLYQVADQPRLFGNVLRSLRPGGRFVVDDWMLTPLTTASDLDELATHFTYVSFGRTNLIGADLVASGFAPELTMVDLGHVGRGPMTRHFERQMREYFAPLIAADWPDDLTSQPGRAAYGLQMVDEFIGGVNVTLRLYAEGKMTYRRLLATKPFE